MGCVLFPLTEENLSMVTLLSHLLCLYVVPLLIHLSGEDGSRDSYTDHQSSICERLALKFRLGEIPPPVTYKIEHNDA